MTDSTMSTLTAGDGDLLAIQDWPIPDRVEHRGVVIVIHGLGEHAGRYDGLATVLTRHGFAVRGYDQHGHGESGGVRGDLPSESRMLDDLADVVDTVRSLVGFAIPIVLLGHSMGGATAARFVAQRVRKVEGLVLSSPALRLRLNFAQRALMATVPHIAPRFSMGNGVKPRQLSHDNHVVQSYQKDPLVHDRISARLAKYIADCGDIALQAAPHWALPTLLLYAGQDQLVDPRGSDDFARLAPPSLVQAERFDQLYHEIFNETERDQPLSVLTAWLTKRYPPQSAQ